MCERGRLVGSGDCKSPPGPSAPLAADEGLNSGRCGLWLVQVLTRPPYSHIGFNTRRPLIIKSWKPADG